MIYRVFGYGQDNERTDCKIVKTRTDKTKTDKFPTKDSADEAGKKHVADCCKCSHHEVNESEEGKWFDPSIVEPIRVPIDPT